MSLHLWLAYMATITIYVFIPGLTVMNAINHGIRFPFSRAVFTMLGAISACSLYILVTVIGLGAILATSHLFFNIIKCLGAIYLFYLGVRSLWEARSSKNHFSFSQRASRTLKSRQSIYLSAFILSVSNPKNIVFFLALFPQFISSNHNHLSQLIILILSFIVVDGLALTFFIVCASKMAKVLAKRQGIDWLNVIIGIIFIAFAVSLLIEKT